MFLQWVDQVDRNSLYRTCRGYYKFYQKWRRQRCLVDGDQEILLRIAQEQCIDTARNFRGTLAIHAPMSFGKTIVGLLIALNGRSGKEPSRLFQTSLLYTRKGKKIRSTVVDAKDRFIIVCQSKGLCTWVDEAIKYFGPESFLRHDPEHSPIIAPISHYKDHLEYAEKGGAVKIDNQNKSTSYFVPSEYNRIIIQTPATYQKRIPIRDPKERTKFIQNLIVDEAHAMRDKRGHSKIPLLMDDKGIRVLLSATGCGEADKTLYLPQESIADEIPDTEVTVHIMKPFQGILYGVQENKRSIDVEFNEQNSLVKANYRNVLFNQSEKMYLRKIKDLIKELVRGTKKSVHIVLYVPGGLIEHEVQDYLGEMSIQMFKHTKANDKKERFKEFRGDAVLLITHNWTEAINIDCDAAILVHPDWIEINRYKQMVGRITRTTNENDVVKVHVIVASGVSFWRFMWYESLRTIRESPFRFMTDDLGDIRADELFATVAIISALGHQIESLSSADIILIVCLCKSENYYEWWTKQTHVLRKDEVASIIENFNGQDEERVVKLKNF